MKVIEQFREGKLGDIKKCEDSIVVTDDFIAIFDGSTSKNNSLYDGKKTGKVASETLAETTQKLPANIAQQEAIETLNASIYRRYEKEGIVNKVQTAPHEQFVAAGIIYSRHHHEIWVVGDCLCRFGRQDHINDRWLSVIQGGARSLYLQQAINAGEVTEDEIAAHDIGRDFIKPLLVGQYYFLNADPSNPYSFCAFNGFPLHHEQVICHKLSHNDDEIILASDGYTKLYNTLEETEKNLVHVLKEDPLCYKTNISTKGLQQGQVSFDDRAYIRFKT